MAWAAVLVCSRGLAADADGFLRGLVASFKGKQGFATDRCPKGAPAAWAGLLLTGQPVVLTYRFAPGCDLQGTVRITPAPFPIDLELRHVAGAERVRATVASETQTELLEGVVRVTARTDDGVFLDGKGEALAFRARYRAELGLDGRPGPGNGGELVAKRFRGKASGTRIALP